MCNLSLTILRPAVDCLGQMYRVIWDLFRAIPTPQKALEAKTEDISRIIHSLGLFNKRAAMIQRFSKEFLYNDWKDVRELHGIGKSVSHPCKHRCPFSLGALSICTLLLLWCKGNTTGTQRAVLITAGSNVEDMCQNCSLQLHSCPCAISGMPLMLMPSSARGGGERCNPKTTCCRSTGSGCVLPTGWGRGSCRVEALSLCCSRVRCRGSLPLL